MEPPLFPTGPHVLRAAPGCDACLVLPLPSGSPPIQLEWTRAGAKVNERFTSSHNTGGVRLSITAARTGDSGVYTLQASNAAGKDTTRVCVDVSPDEMPTGDDPPTFLRRLQDLTVKVGTRTRFLVEIVSSTECRVTWYRNDRRLMEAERIALVRDGNFWCADVSAVSVEDAGRWTCTVENRGGRASCSAHLNVLVPKAYKRPEFVEELRALLTEQGTVSLECKVVGVPTPVLRWFKDSREIKAGDVFALTANAEDPTSLGTYTCEAVNCMGRAYSSSKVQVVGRSSREGTARPSSGGLIEPPPIFTKELEDQFVRICEPLTLSCHIVVPPWPRSVVWYNKEGKVEASDKYHILEDGVGGYFIEIQTSEFADEGEWKCVATSAGGRVGISTCYVSMDVPKNYRKPRFMENLQAVLTEEGLVSFECKVVGFPTPVLSWFKDGQELKPGDVYQLTGTNSLGSYCCIARNFMGQASSSAELTVEDIQNQLNEEEKLQLFSKNQAPKFLQGLKSVEAKIDEPFRFTIKVAIPPEPTVLWYRDEQPVDESSRCHLGNEERGVFFLDIQNLEFMDQAEWKCVAMNDYGQSVTSCFLKLVIPRHYKKPRFLENLQAILSDEGSVNLECKVIGVPQPVLKWYKDGEELKPGDIHRIISGQDGTCCLGTYTCEAQNCMGIAASSASLLGFEDSIKAKNKKQIDDQTLQRNLSLSTIHEERTSQMYDTPVGDITLDDKGEISFSFDGKEVSVSLYETPDLTEEEALQIVEMYADQLSENVTEHNVVELPPLRFVKETSTSGNLLMEAIIIDVSPEYFTSPEEDLRTEADIEDISIADENGPPQLSLDQEVSGEDYLEKTMALLSEERTNIPKKIERKKSDSQRSADDYFSLSRDRSSSAEKKDDDTQVLSESDLQSFASAHSTGKPKSKSSKPSLEDGQESSDVTKTVLLREDLKDQLPESISAKRQKERRSSRGSKSSITSEKSAEKELLEEVRKNEKEKIITEDIKSNMMNMSSSLTKVMNAIQIIERDIILKSELMAVAATASRSLEIINSLITPLSEIHSVADAVIETANESPEIICSLFNRLPQSLRMLEQSLTIVEKCIDFESENKTLVKKTCLLLIENCGETLKELITTVNTIDYQECAIIDDICISNIKAASENILKTLLSSAEASKQDKILNQTSDSKMQVVNLESKHLHHTQKVLYELKSSLKSVLSIIEGSDKMNINLADIKNSEIILDEISTPIQELQNSLEQIESLSVAESDSNLPNFNTEIIETVMNSVLKLRTAFEQLSSGKENKINEVLLDIKEYINAISSQLDLFEDKNGKFDILYNDNKLEVLQTMAQILISLENSLPILDAVPSIKTNMSDFHKNLTKVLENVIESNDSKKYFSLLEICNAVSRINTSLNNMESRQVLSLAVLSNTLKIIRNNMHATVFDTHLNNSVLNNINDLLLNIEETINQVEESSLNIETEKVDDLSIKPFEEEKLNFVLEHVQKSIAAISKVTSFESVGKLDIAHVLENIHPILTEIQCCLASSNINTQEHPDNVSDISISSFTETIAHPLYELYQNISVLNEVICENAKNMEINQLTAFAEPLIDLQTTLEVLQNEVISQYDEMNSYPEIVGTIANSVDYLQSCIVMIQEQDVIEVVDDMSTLADISGIKTTADTVLPFEQYMTATIEEVKIEESADIFQNILQTCSGQALKGLNKHIETLQNMDILENFNSLPDDHENTLIKSFVQELEVIHSNILSILHPVEMEVSQELTISPSQLALLIRPLKHFQQCLLTVNTTNIPVFKNDEKNSVYVKHFSEILLNLKDDINNFLNVLQSAVETVDTAIDIASKKVALRQISVNLENLLSECTDFPIDKSVKMELINLRTDVSDALDNTEKVNEITEKVHGTLSKVQDEALNFSAHNLNVLSHEVKLVEIFNDIEQNITTLENYDFIEESAILTSNTDELSQIAEITKVDPLIQLDQTTNSLVTTLVNELNEGSENDVKVIDEFCITFTKELSLLGYLVKNLTSPKTIVKSMQLFYDLCRNLNDFKTRDHKELSEEGSKYLQASINDMEESLKNVQLNLIQTISIQSELLFDIPLIKMKDGEQFLKNMLQSKNNTSLDKTYSLLLTVMESLKPLHDDFKSSLIEELRTSGNIKLHQDNIIVSENYDLLHSFLTETAINSSEGPTKQITEKMIEVIHKHGDLKNILGVGKIIIFIKCISDCLDILEQNFIENKVKESAEKCTPKEINIDEILLEISNPLECLNTQIMNIRNKLLLASRNDIELTDLRTLEANVEEIRKIDENVKLCINNEKCLMASNDIILAVELKNKICLIISNLNNLEKTPSFEAIKAVIQPIEEMEKHLGLIISSNRNLIDEKSQSNKAKAEALLQQMEQHIEIIEIVEEVSAVIKLDDLKETANIVRELRDSIAMTETTTDSGEEKCSVIKTDQTQLTDKLQRALTTLHSQALDSVQDTETVKTDVRQQIIDVVSDLQKDLVQLNNISFANLSENEGSDTQVHIIKAENDNTIDGKSDKSTDKIQISDNTIKLENIPVKNERESEQLSTDISEDISSPKSTIDILLQSIQEYSSQDFTEIAQEFASVLNCEAIKITQEITQQFCQETVSSDIVSMETTGPLIISEEKLKIELHENLQNIFKSEPDKVLEEVIIEDKLLQYKNLTSNLCKAIENFQNTTNITIADESKDLVVKSPEVMDPILEFADDTSSIEQCEELHPLLSEIETISYNKAVEKSNEDTDNLKNEVSLTQQDSKSSQVLDTQRLVEIEEDNMTELPEQEYGLVQNMVSTEPVYKTVDTKVKEQIVVQEGNLAACITEYISEEITEIFKLLSPSLNTEHIEKSHQIANQLFTLCNVTNFDNSNVHDHMEKILDVSIQLNEAIMVIYDEVFDDTKVLQCSVEHDALQKVKNVLNNLVGSLQVNITTEQPLVFEQVTESDRELLILNSLSKHADKTEEAAGNADLVTQLEKKEANSSNNENVAEILVQEMIYSEGSLPSAEIEEGELLTIQPDRENEISSIQMLEKLLNEVNDSIDLSLSNVENSEILQNNLDEVQSVIIKLKCDFDGTTNEALNETLEDLECNVRSVQLQINEQSAPALLKEACINLQVIVASLNESDFQDVKEKALASKIDVVIDKCHEESDHTIDLLDKACKLEGNSKLENIISSLNNIKDTMKSLRNSFVGDPEILIVKGIDVVQNLDQVEDKIFSLERDVDRLECVDDNIRDDIITAMHSVYGSISNMRGAISSIQKKYMYENYGKPSQNFLKSIKNIAVISLLNQDNEANWRQCAKFLRKVLNHFEDIKFYINFDRTARIPNDAAFTKIILQEIVSVLGEVQKLNAVNSDIAKILDILSKDVAGKRMEIEEKTTMEVKEKIPIFINLANKILEATEAIKLQLQDLKSIQTNNSELIVVLEKSIQMEESKEENADILTVGDQKYEATLKAISQEENMLQKASESTISVLFKGDELKDNGQVDINIEDESTNPKLLLAEEVQIDQQCKEYEKDNKKIDMEESILLVDNELKNYQVTPHDLNSNLLDLENTVTEKKDTVALNESTQQTSDSLMNLENIELPISNTEENAYRETDIKIREDNNAVNTNVENEVKETKQSEITRDMTSDSNTTSEFKTSELSFENLKPQAFKTENIQFDEQKGTLKILETKHLSGVMTNISDITVEEKIDDNSKLLDEAQILEKQQKDMNIETDMDAPLTNNDRRNSVIIETDNVTVNITGEIHQKTDEQSICDTEKNKINDQLQEINLSKNDENDDTLKMNKVDTGVENIQDLICLKDSASLADCSSDVTHENVPKEVPKAVQEQIPGEDQKIQNSTKANEFSNEKEKVLEIVEETNSDLLLNELSNSKNRKEENVLDLNDFHKSVDKDDVVLNEETVCVLAPDDLQIGEPLEKDEKLQIKEAVALESICEDSSFIAEANMVYIEKDNHEVLTENEVDLSAHSSSFVKQVEQKLAHDLSLESENKKDTEEEKEINKKVTQTVEKRKESIDNSCDILSKDDNLPLEDKSMLKLEEINTPFPTTDKSKEIINMDRMAITEVNQECLLNFPSHSETKDNKQTEQVQSYVDDEKASVAEYENTDLLHIVQDMADNLMVMEDQCSENTVVFTAKSDVTCEKLKPEYKETWSETSEEAFRTNNQETILYHEDNKDKETESMVGQNKEQKSVKIQDEESDNQIMLNDMVEKREQKPEDIKTVNLENKESEFDADDKQTPEKTAEEMELVGIVKDTIESETRRHKKIYKNDEDFTVDTIVKEDHKGTENNKTEIRNEEAPQDNLMINKKDLSETDALNIVEVQESLNRKVKEPDSQFELDEVIKKEKKEISAILQSDLKPDLENEKTKDAKTYSSEEKPSVKENIIKRSDSNDDKKQEQMKIGHLEFDNEITTNEKSEESNEKEDSKNKDEVSVIVENKKEILMESQKPELSHQVVFTETVGKEIQDATIMNESVRENKETETSNNFEVDQEAPFKTDKEIDSDKVSENSNVNQINNENSNIYQINNKEQIIELPDKIDTKEAETYLGDENGQVKTNKEKESRNVIENSGVGKVKGQDEIKVKEDLLESVKEIGVESKERPTVSKISEETHVKSNEESISLKEKNDMGIENKDTVSLNSNYEQKKLVECKQLEFQHQSSLSHVNEKQESIENVDSNIEKIATVQVEKTHQDDNIKGKDENNELLPEIELSAEIKESIRNEDGSTKNNTKTLLKCEIKEEVKDYPEKKVLKGQNEKRDDESVKCDEKETGNQALIRDIITEEKQEFSDSNQSFLQKEMEEVKSVASKGLPENDNVTEKDNSCEKDMDKNRKKEGWQVDKTEKECDTKAKDVNDNSVTVDEDKRSDIYKDSTSENKQEETVVDKVVEKTTQICDDNNVVDENKCMGTDKSVSNKKADEVKNNKQKDKPKKITKKKLKPDKSMTVEKKDDNNEEKGESSLAKQEFKQEDIKDEKKELDVEKPQHVSVSEKENNLISAAKDTYTTQYKSTTIENNNDGIEDLQSRTTNIHFSKESNEKEMEIIREQKEEKNNVVRKKSNDEADEGRLESKREKHLPKESPVFVDHNKPDYMLDFPRPPNYTSKSYDTDDFINSDLHLNNKNSTIYKAQTLVQDYQTRSSYSPHIDKTDQSLDGPPTRSKSKAVSESRSTTLERRTTRDHKRKPMFSTFLTDRTAVESSRVKLTCSILSSSDPTITWYKNGILLNDKQKFRTKYIDGLITLEVLNAVPNDSGEYSCTVDNENGSVTSTANLKVYPSFEASPIPPTFTRSIRDVYHSFENELVLECRIRGQPLPSITWFKDNKPITLCERYQAHYLADGVCRLTISSPTKEDSGKYTCHAESSIWSDEISHNVQFTGKESSVSPNIVTLDKVHFNRQALESRKPHFTNVISDCKVVSGGTIGLQVEIKGSPLRVEWLRDGCSVTETYRNAQTYFDHGIYTLALPDVTETETGLYTCRAWSSHGNVDMNASITVVQPNQIDGKPAVIVSRPAKDLLISVGEDINISFRVQGEPKPKVFFMKGLRDITHSQRVCKMTSDDYTKFTMKRSVVSDAGTYCVFARNAYGCDRAFVTVMIRQRASSENLVSDWTYPMDDLAISALDRNYKAVPDRIPSEPSVVDGGKNWVSLAWPKPDCQTKAPILAYKVESWLIGKEGGARWSELGITPRNSYDAFNLKQEEEYHFRITPRNRYGWGESVQTSSPIGIGLTGDRPEFIEILPGQLKVLLGETATLCCTFKGKPAPEIVWMKNGHDIEEDTNRVKITQNSYKACFYIQNVKIEDEGRYSCEASNVHGRSSTYARMTVITDRNIWEADAKLKRERSSGVGEYPPQFTMRLRDRRVQATYPVRLTCQVVGSPAPILVWFKDGEEVTANDRNSMSQDEYFYTLEIAPTSLDDGGVYEAMARNSSGAISCRCSLVVDKGIRAYIAPEFCCGLEPLYQMREGEELRISAVVEAYPSVGVCWYRDGVRLRPSRRAIMTLDRDGQIELALASVTARDAGVYTCTASNEVGRVSTSGKVEIIAEENRIDNVNAPPIFVSDEASSTLYSNEPRFLRKPRSSEAREGDTVIIECEVIGDPKPEVYWLRDFLKPDYYRDANHFKRVGAGPEYRFEIPHAKLDYTGAYSVVAKNIHGEAKAIISLQILARDPNSSQDTHNIRYGLVEEIPRFEKELTDLLCYDGDAVEFECRVSANPDPYIKWFHYAQLVPDCSDFESSYDHGTARLKIKQVTAEDEGTYKCEASNSLGKVTSSACLVVYPPGEPNTLSQRLRRPPVLLSGASTPRSTPRTTPRTTPARSLSATPGPDSRNLCSPCREIAPKFYTYPFNRVAEEGDTVVFQCAVKGLPPPWATWDKDGIIITASSRINIKEKDEMFRILEIEEVNIEDVGLYRITLENDYGRAEASARLEVISGKGKFHGTTRSFSASPSRRALTYRRRTPSFSRLD